MNNFTADGTPADMATYRKWRVRDHENNLQLDADMKLRLYEVICQQFEKIVDYIANGGGVPSEAPIYDRVVGTGKRQGRQGIVSH